nr:response regulator transcription factor [uncultured Faecalicatena sp.]
MERILVVEDDLALNAGLCFELDAAGYASVAAYNCRKAQYLTASESFSLVILDVNLPDGNGFDLCRDMKTLHPELPIVFLTANDLEADVLNGLDLGAEDYITKPFSTSVLVKKIGILLRRGQRIPLAEAAFDDGNLLLDLENMVALRGGEKIAITPNEYKILRLLIANAGNIVSRQRILEKVFDSVEHYIDDHALTVNINRLRNKIEDENHTYIKTIRGMGYAWIGGRA